MQPYCSFNFGDYLPGDHGQHFEQPLFVHCPDLVNHYLRIFIQSTAGWYKNVKWIHFLDIAG